MKKLLTFLSSILSLTVCSNSYIIETNLQIQTLNKIKSTNESNESVLKNIDLSKLNIDKWTKDQFYDDNININVNNLYGNSYKDFLTQICSMLDKKYASNEHYLLPRTSDLAGKVFIGYLDLLKLNSDIKFEILDNSTSAKDHNQFSNNLLFDKLEVPENNIYAYNVRLTNLNNNSYFDFSVNICNFDTLDPVQIASSEDLNLGMNTDKNVSSIGIYNISTPTYTFLVSDICPQFTNYKIASYFLDPTKNLSYSFSITISDKYSDGSGDNWNGSSLVENVNLNSLPSYLDISKENPENTNDGNYRVTDQETKTYSNDGVSYTAGYNNIYNKPNAAEPEKIYLQGELLSSLKGKTNSYIFRLEYHSFELDANYNSSIFENNPNTA